VGDEGIGTGGVGDDGAGDGGAGDAGRVIGTVIGVVIRGGSIGDDDHCEIHPRRRGRGSIAINDRLPRSPFPATGGTFPTGGIRFPR
jgi:hypothetical protein